MFPDPSSQGGAAVEEEVGPRAAARAAGRRRGGGGAQPPDRTPAANPWLQARFQELGLTLTRQPLPDVRP